MSVVALAGGVGAARLLRGLVRAVPPEDVTAIVNTGDDREFYGVHVSPDVDIVCYTLAGIVDAKRGYGIEGDGFRVVDALGELGHETWFRLGDRDFAHCQHRTLRLREGAGLAAVTDELRRSLGSRRADPADVRGFVSDYRRSVGRAARALRGISRAGRRPRRRRGSRPLGGPRRAPRTGCPRRHRGR